MIEIPLTLSDGKPRTLRYTLGSFRRLRERGIDLMTMPEEQLLFSVVEFLWAGLVWEDGTLTPETVAELVPLADAARVLEAITTALGANQHKVMSNDMTTGKLILGAKGA